MATLLKALLQQRHLQTVSAFNREYDRIARRIDPHIVGSGPKKAQFYRWLSGSIAGLPYPHHRRVLTEMFPGWSMEELFAPYTGGIGDLARNRAESAGSTNNDAPGDRVIVYGSRVDFLRAMPPQELFAAANSIDLTGISLNLFCQQFSDTALLRLLEDGVAVRCLFLNPEGRHTAEREREENHAAGTLRSLTRLNMHVLQRAAALGSTPASARLELRIYDAPARFNITIVDRELCVMQPYLPHSRGVEAPAFVTRRSEKAGGVFDTFAAVFQSTWTDAREVTR